MKGIFTFSVAAMAVSAFATPHVDSDTVDVSQDQEKHLVEITYVLSDEPAVVTLDIQTNNAALGSWESIGGERMTHLAGDVNRLVCESAERKTIWWRPDKDWPEGLVSAGGVRAVVQAWATNAPPDWMVVDLLRTNSVRWYATEESIPLGTSNFLYKSEKLVMRKVPAAGVIWKMGRGTTAAPYHRVTLTEDYYLAIYETTQEQWRNAYNAAAMSFLNDSPSYYGRSSRDDWKTRPVEKVNYLHLRGDRESYDWPNTTPLHDVDPNRFLGKLRTFTGIDFDLPTEAQWEYACRAGTSSEFNDGSSSWRAVAWFPAMMGLPVETYCVGQKQRNNWGFYDMHGNVDEWCLDWYVDPPDGSDATDPKGPTSGSTSRCLRGADWTVASEGGILARGANGGRYRATQDETRQEHGFRLWCPAVAK